MNWVRARIAVIGRGFSPNDIVRLKDLFELVGPVPGVEVLIDDRPVPFSRELWLPLLWFHLLD